MKVGAQDPTERKIKGTQKVSKPMKKTSNDSPQIQPTYCGLEKILFERRNQDNARPTYGAASMNESGSLTRPFPHV